MLQINVKRIYDEAESTDGMRILVDRIWPRGVSKEKAQLTGWMKEIAPSTELRVWFHQTPETMTEKFELFRERYTAELSDSTIQNELKQLRDWASQQTVTLLYAARTQELNHAHILKQYLEQLNANEGKPRFVP